jgi:hypothetical protein
MLRCGRRVMGVRRGLFKEEKHIAVYVMVREDELQHGGNGFLH